MENLECNINQRKIFDDVLNKFIDPIIGTFEIKDIISDIIEWVNTISESENKSISFGRCLYPHENYIACFVTMPESDIEVSCDVVNSKDRINNSIINNIPANNYIVFQISDNYRETTKNIISLQASLRDISHANMYKQLEQDIKPKIASNAGFQLIITRCHNEVCDINDSLKYCAKCRKVKYCSRECQIEDWRNHKLVCCKSDVIYTNGNIVKLHNILSEDNKSFVTEGFIHVELFKFIKETNLIVSMISERDEFGYSFDLTDERFNLFNHPIYILNELLEDKGMYVGSKADIAKCIYVKGKIENNILYMYTNCIVYSKHDIF